MDAKHLKIATLAALTLLVASANGAVTKCTVRAADTLIAERYTGCKPKSLISYLHNNLVTPYSFTCAKKISAACKATGCENPTTADEVSRCLTGYAAILDTCPKELDDAAVMARCKDSKAWSVAAIAARSAAAPMLVAMTPSAVFAPAVAAAPLVAPAVIVPTAPTAPVVALQPMGPPAPSRVYSDVEVIRLRPVTTSSSRVKVERAPANAPQGDSPVTVEPLPNDNPNRLVRKTTQTSQSSRRIR